MAATILEQVVSPRSRWVIADMLSVRPRTLRELAARAGISVQGVLKHLRKLDELGLLEETELKGNEYVSVRKVYSTTRRRISDYSAEQFLIAHLSSARKSGDGGEQRGESLGLEALESLSEDILVQRQRIRSLAKRMEKMVAELEESEEELSEAILSRDISGELKLIALALFSEDDRAETMSVIRKHYGCEDPEGAIAAAIAGLNSTAGFGTLVKL